MFACLNNISAVLAEQERADAAVAAWRAFMQQLREAWEQAQRDVHAQATAAEDSARAQARQVLGAPPSPPVAAGPAPAGAVPAWGIRLPTDKP